MKTNLPAKFRRRFNNIKEFEKREIRKTTIKEKLLKLSSLVSLAVGLGISLSKGRKKQMIDTNWALLKCRKFQPM